MSLLARKGSSNVHICYACPSCIQWVERRVYVFRVFGAMLAAAEQQRQRPLKKLHLLRRQSEQEQQAALEQANKEAQQQLRARVTLPLHTLILMAGLYGLQKYALHLVDTGDLSISIWQDNLIVYQLRPR